MDCALALQDDGDLSLRIGIHLGDVVEKNGEVMGDGVNIAARIRPLAEPGGTCVSEAVWSAVRSHHGLSAQRLGRKSLKNVDRPVEVWALAPAGAEVRPRRWRRVAAGLALAAVLLGGAWLAVGDAVVAWALVNAWPVIANPVEQELGFATTSDGVRIAYATTGEGPVLVSVIGWASHLERGMWSPLYDRWGVISSLSREHTLVRYDGRGFGLSQRDVDDFSLDARVRDIEAVVDAVGAERVAVWATSAGGPAGIAYTARHPERVSHLVLFGAMPGGWSHLSAEQVKMLRGSFALMREHWESPPVRGILVHMINPDIGGVDQRVLSEFLAASGDGSAVAGFLGENGRIDIADEAMRIAVPTLVIHGREDATVPVESGVELASLIPGARLELFEGGHVGTLSTAQMRDVMDRIAAFVAQPATP